MKLSVLILIFQGFPQPKAIRDNSGFFHQEVYYPGSSGNSIQHQSAPVPLPTFPPSVQTTLQPIIVTIPARSEVDTSVVRSVLNRQNIASVPATVPTTATTNRPRTTTEPATSEEIDDQNRSAHYKFGTSVHDTINDHEHVRQEVRSGLALKGMYSYSDGYFRRTVHYEADEGGYRVVKEDIQPIGDGEGPKFNPDGQAAVKSTLSGDYSITADDFKLNKRQEEIRGKTRV